MQNHNKTQRPVRKTKLTEVNEIIKNLDLTITQNQGNPCHDELLELKRSLEHKQKILKDSALEKQRILGYLYHRLREVNQILTELGEILKQNQGKLCYTELVKANIGSLNEREAILQKINFVKIKE